MISYCRATLICEQQFYTFSDLSILHWLSLEEFVTFCHCSFTLCVVRQTPHDFNTVQSRFLEPPEEMQIGSRNRRWHQITLNWSDIV